MFFSVRGRNCLSAVTLLVVLPLVKSQSMLSQQIQLTPKMIVYCLRQQLGFSAKSWLEVLLFTRKVIRVKKLTKKRNKTSFSQTRVQMQTSFKSCSEFNSTNLNEISFFFAERILFLLHHLLKDNCTLSKRKIPVKDILSRWLWIF